MTEAGAPGRRRGRTSAKARSASIGDLYAALDAIAPFAGAEEWDNVGLLAGRADWPLGRALVALDLTDDVAREAIRRQVDALVLFHPPIFKGARTVTPDAEGPTNLLADLLAERISIVCTHTAFDAAVGGTNDLLLDLVDVVERTPLRESVAREEMYKLVVFVPPAEVAALRGALSKAGAGVIGHYTECSYELAGRGTFKGDESTNPTVGRKELLEHADETRLEMVVPTARLGDVVRTLYAAHSYEEPAFDLYPVHAVAGRGMSGQGRVGRLRKPTRGTRLLEQLGAGVDLSIATCVGDLKRAFTHVAAAGGAFGVRDFRDAQTFYVTGEFKHHDALGLLRRGVTAVCLGHYASERLVLEKLRERLGAALRGVRIQVARADRSPFQPVGKG